MGYYIDFNKISTARFKEMLKAADLLPSRMILKDNIDEYFDEIEKQKIKNVEELQKALKNKNKLQEFCKQSGIPEEYLKILIREINSYQPKPNLIKDFPGIAGEVVQKLEKEGIKNTLQLYERALTPEDRTGLAVRTGIGMYDILRLTRFTDLSRIRWVNHTFAYMLLEVGYTSAEKVAEANYKIVYEVVKKLNEEKKIFKGNIGVHDMKLLVEAAQDLPFDIKFE